MFFLPIEGKFSHVRDDFFNFGIKMMNFFGFFTETRVGGGDNFHKGNYSTKMCYNKGVLLFMINCLFMCSVLKTTPHKQVILWKKIILAKMVAITN